MSVSLWDLERMHGARAEASRTGKKQERASTTEVRIESSYKIDEAIFTQGVSSEER